jgi:hypothetical protein
MKLCMCVSFPFQQQKRGPKSGPARNVIINNGHSLFFITDHYQKQNNRTFSSMAMTIAFIEKRIQRVVK